MQKSPHEIADDLMEMVDQYGLLGERLNEIKKLYAIWWETMRKDFKSDRSAEKAWDLTKEGLEMAEIQLKIRVKDKKMSAYKTYLRVLETEAKNQF